MKNLNRLKIVAALASVSAYALWGLEACSSDSTAATDAGQDGTTNDVVTGDVNVSDTNSDAPQTNDGGCPTYNGSSAFCKEIVEHCATCGASSLNLNACSLQNFAAVCEFENNLISAQVVAAEQSCINTCDPDAGNVCTKAALADASLSTAQEKLTTDFCARCGQGAGCAAQIAKSLNVVEYGDTLANTIDTTCTPDAGGPDSGACGAYSTCAVGILFQEISSAPCADAGGD